MQYRKRSHIRSKSHNGEFGGHDENFNLGKYLINYCFPTKAFGMSRKVRLLWFRIDPALAYWFLSSIFFIVKSENAYLKCSVLMYTSCAGVVTRGLPDLGRCSTFPARLYRLSMLDTVFLWIAFLSAIRCIGMPASAMPTIWLQTSRDTYLTIVMID